MPTAHRVVVVEDEKVLRTSMLRGLARVPGVQAEGAGTVADAIALFEQGPVHLLVSDIDLPDRLGIELIGELRSRHPAAPIVFVSAYLKAFQSQIPKNAQVQVFEKPLSIEQLREIVIQHVGQSSAQAAAPFGLADYLQLAALGRHSVRVEMHTPTGVGYVFVVSGEAWAAFDPHGAGKDAFYRLAAAHDVTVVCSSHNGDGVERNLSGGIESLLLDAARLRDEGRTPSVLAHDQELAAAAAQVVADDAVNSIRDAAMESMMTKDYKKALELFEQAVAMRPEDRLVQANIQRLRALMSANQ